MRHVAVSWFCETSVKAHWSPARIAALYKWRYYWVSTSWWLGKCGRQWSLHGLAASKLLFLTKAFLHICDLSRAWSGWGIRTFFLKSSITQSTDEKPQKQSNSYQFVDLYLTSHFCFMTEMFACICVRNFNYNRHPISLFLNDSVLRVICCLQILLKLISTENVPAAPKEHSIFIIFFPKTSGRVWKKKLL